MDDEGVSHRVILLAFLALVLFIFQAFVFTNFFEIGSLVFSGIFCYLMFFIARNSFLHKREIEDNLKIKDSMDIRIDFWG